MHTLASRHPDPSHQAIGELLSARGFALDDFTVVEDRSPQLSDLFGLIGGVVVVRRLSSGEERVYAAGTGTAWYGALAADIDAGHFGSRQPPAPPAGPAEGPQSSLLDLG